MPELRKDPVTGRWVIIATDRARLPGDFVRQPVVEKPGRFCPFCSGNELKTPPEVLAYRDKGAANEPGWTLRVIPNKFPALRVEGHITRQGEGLYDRMTGIGAHEVVIETPSHTISMSGLPEKHIENVFWAFRDRINDLKRDSRLRYIVVFKNHGELAGSSIEHSHSQLIALPVVPKQVIEEMDGARRYFDFKERCIYCDIAHQESESMARVVIETEHFMAMAPYAPRYPFETWIVPHRHESHFENSTPEEMQNLAWVMRSLLRRMDKTLERPAFNFMLHTAPVQEGALQHYHWHIEVMPRLTKVAGFEWGTGFYINPTPPEEAARFLREAGLT
ncbi:MAG: galactose-1-phosphate uridylyltransferase [Acidobacteria bacterium]|nr:galactose-1-phosphate uridylyltransferase [Acidobacteriota bacterium]